MGIAEDRREEFLRAVRDIENKVEEYRDKVSVKLGECLKAVYPKEIFLDAICVETGLKSGYYLQTFYVRSLEKSDEDDFMVCRKFHVPLVDNPSELTICDIRAIGYKIKLPDRRACSKRYQKT